MPAGRSFCLLELATRCSPVGAGIEARRLRSAAMASFNEARGLAPGALLSEKNIVGLP